jgi:para-aminobenzoate synthetase component II
VIVILDNRDSFVMNVAHRLDELGAARLVLPSHSTRLDEILRLEPRGLIVSPGPQGPDEAGVSTAAIRALGRRGVPVLGICLGHQCIASAFDVVVEANPNAMHGRASLVRHDGLGVYAGIPNPLSAGRYHALAAVEPPPDGPLLVSARLDDETGLVMGLRHRELPVEGVQFHPESVLTPYGYRLLANFVALCGDEPAEGVVSAAIAAAERVLEPAPGR